MKTGLKAMQVKSGQWVVGSRQWRERGERPQAPGIRLRETQSSSPPSARRPLSTRAAFTLTELLIVIAIIAVLAGLITAAAVNAMRGAQRNSITLDIKNISGALENFKNDYGAYPPNGMNPQPTSTVPSSPARLVPADFARMFKKAFPRHQEPDYVIAALCGANTGATVPNNVNLGISSAEALVFWLGGFSEDPQFPISGTGGPSFSDLTGDNDGTLESTDEVLENRNWRYQFEVTNLGPRTDDGLFDETRGRYLEYQIDLNNNGANDPGELRRINLWTYRPGSSEQPLVYFDTSRYKPYQYDVWAAEPNPATGNPPYIFAFKQVRSGATGTPTNAAEYQSNIVFIDQGKFQILHCGLDDDWGSDAFGRMSLNYSGPSNTPMGWGTADFSSITLYPVGPFIGAIGDTLTSFTEGTIADATEE